MIPLRTKFLLADDDADDTLLFCEALASVAPNMECHTVENGRVVFEVLAKRQKDSPDVMFPDVFFLDINMPIMNGWECLKKLRDHSDYKEIPAIMYSTSSAKSDIDLAYRLGALVFVTKPDDFKELCKILAVIATSSEASLVSHLSAFGSVKLN